MGTAVAPSPGSAFTFDAPRVDVDAHGNGSGQHATRRPSSTTRCASPRFGDPNTKHTPHVMRGCGSDMGFASPCFACSLGHSCHKVTRFSEIAADRAFLGHAWYRMAPIARAHSDAPSNLVLHRRHAPQSGDSRTRCHLIVSSHRLLSGPYAHALSIALSASLPHNAGTCARSRTPGLSSAWTSDRQAHQSLHATILFRISFAHLPA